MFAKLLKYELKSVGKWYFALNISVLAISLFLGLSLGALSTSAVNSYEVGYEIGSSLATSILPISLSLAFGLLIAGSAIATLIIIIRRFYTNLFGREGYLTLTLPVSTNQIILSKLLASFIWTVFNLLIVSLGIVLLIIPLSGLEKVLIALPYISQSLSGLGWGLAFLYIFTSTLAGTLLIYLAIAIGQLFSDKRILMAIVAYFVLVIINTIIFGIIDSNLLSTADLFTAKYFAYYSFEYFIRMMICYYATYFIIKNKLNIQ